MSEILKWRDEWTLQIDVLDEDHVELVELFNRIASLYGTLEEVGARSGAPGRLAPVAEAAAGRAQESCPDGGAALLECLERLSDRTREHFRREEEFMRGIDYPELADHKSEHDLLLAEFTDLMRGLRERRTETLDFETLDDLKRWLISHIVGEDRRFAEFYYGICGAREQTESAPTADED